MYSLKQWFSIFSKPLPILYFLKVCMAHCSVDRRCWTIALWPPPRKKSSPLSSQRDLPSDFPELQKKKRFSPLGEQFLSWSPKKRKRSSPLEERFLPWSEKKVSASESSIFVNSPIDITEIRLFWTKQLIFRIALWPTAKSPMAHWLRNPGLKGNLSQDLAGGSS